MEAFDFVFFVSHLPLDNPLLAEFVKTHARLFKRPIVVSPQIFPRKRFLQSQSLGELYNHFTVVTALPDLGQFLPCEHAPNLVQVNHVLLFQPRRCREHQIGKLCRGREEEV